MDWSWWPWSRGRRSAPAAPSDAHRWVVVDVESSGLDARRDRLLAIAAVAVHIDAVTHKPRIDLADSFEVFLQQPAESARRIDKPNILIHRIGMGAQLAGVPPREALQQWLDYLGDAPLVAYHSPFDEMMIARALKEHLARSCPNPWLDLEPLAAVLHGDPRRRSLDHWLDQHRIPCLARHQAAADTLATAELLLVLWPRLLERLNLADGPPQVAQVVDLADGHRFLPGRQGSR